jgi:hypothetical protein
LGSRSWIEGMAWHGGVWNVKCSSGVFTRRSGRGGWIRIAAVARCSCSESSSERPRWGLAIAIVNCSRLTCCQLERSRFQLMISKLSHRHQLLRARSSSSSRPSSRRPRFDEPPISSIHLCRNFCVQSPRCRNRPICRFLVPPTCLCHTLHTITHTFWTS